jgi:beta-glucanase (GH16 family)
MSRLRTRELAAVALALAVPACGGSGSRAASAPASTAGASAAPAGFTLVFADEFDTPGSPDPAKWGYELGDLKKNDEKEYYTSRAENVRVEDGMLVIEARKESYEGHGYTSASVVTLGRFEFRYGKVEVRAKLPTGRGTWPAIWMLGTSIGRVGWPACGEIDIMEQVGFDPLRVHASIHTTAYNHTINTQKTASTLVLDPSASFHVYATEWYPDRIETFVDGVRYFSFRNEGSGSAAWPFDAPQYLLVNLAIGGTWGGQQGIDDSLFPHRYLVDYVRIYQQR